MVQWCIGVYTPCTNCTVLTAHKFRGCGVRFAGQCNAITCTIFCQVRRMVRRCERVYTRTFRRTILTAHKFRVCGLCFTEWCGAIFRTIFCQVRWCGRTVSALTPHLITDAAMSHAFVLQPLAAVGVCCARATRLRSITHRLAPLAHPAPSSRCRCLAVMSSDLLTDMRCVADNSSI